MIKITSNVADVISRLQGKVEDINAAGSLICESLAYVGEEVASDGFSGAEYPGTNDVSVSVEAGEKEAKVVATGNAVYYIEFGAGVTQPGYPGPLPEGIVAHGGLSSPHARSSGWWIYKGSPGTGAVLPVVDRHGVEKEGVHKTYGNPPASAMYHAVIEMEERYKEVAKEVLE